MSPAIVDSLSTGRQHDDVFAAATHVAQSPGAFAKIEQSTRRRNADSKPQPCAPRRLQPGGIRAGEGDSKRCFSVDDAIAQSDGLWENAPLMRRLLDSCIIEDELRRRNVSLEPARVQATLEELRRRRGLLSDDALKAWMADTGVSLRVLHDMAEEIARSNKLRELIVGEHFERYLKDHRDEADVVSLAILQLSTLEMAREFVALLGTPAADFTKLAQQAYVEDASGGTLLSFRKEPRYKLAQEFGDDVRFTPGAIIESSGGRTIHYVMGIDRVVPTDEVRHRLETKLFEDWLRDQRAARTGWFSEDAERT